MEGELFERVVPLLSALGIETAGFEERDAEALRVESVGPARAGAGPCQVRIYRPGEDEAREFEALNEYALASAILSHVLGLPSPMLTADEKMFAVIRAAVRTATADSPIMLTGETGTGKEVLVRMIHAASGRGGGMSSVNCAALNDSLAADAKRLAQSGADGGAIGVDDLFAAPDTTLFLDQVTELSHASQTWVLHALTRAAETATTPVARPGARLVSAANRALEPLVAWEEFRHELYDRLAVLTIVLPPLRERPADIALLATHFLRATAPHLSLTPGTLKALASYPFPGNVRELHNLVTRLAVEPREAAGGVIHATEVRALLASDKPASIWKASPIRMRREMALQALSACKGDRIAAARKLGISVRALQQHVAGSRSALQGRDH
jgi:DNA-binding NtrC family response regulator